MSDTFGILGRIGSFESEYYVVMFAREMKIKEFTLVAYDHEGEFVEQKHINVDEWCRPIDESYEDDILYELDHDPYYIEDDYEPFTDLDCHWG